jgi:phage-related minor tail protein
MASASGGVGGLLGAAFGGFRAGGGPVEPGRAYVVGERGKEVFMPSVPGMIVPRVANLGGGAIGISQNITVNVTGSAGTEKQNNDLAAKIAGQLGPVAQSMVGKEIRRQMRPGGLLAVGR